MFKFKMSLLLKSMKFRVAVAVLAIAAILAGIVFIPKNKAALPTEDVLIQSNPMGISAGNAQLYVVLKAADSSHVNGYNNLFCVQEDAELSYSTFRNPIDISSASGYFSNYGSAMWLINNMYVTNTVGANGTNDTNAKTVLALNLANLVTSDAIKSKVKSDFGFDGSSVTPEKVFNLRNKTIGTTYTKNALEVVEQIALWRYTKNVGTSFSSAYRSNPNQFLTGANLTDDEQRTLKYTYYALTTLADMNSSSSTSISTPVTIDKSQAKFDESNFKVGPYYLKSNGITLTSFSFGEAANGKLPVVVEITNADGSKATPGTEIFEKNADGSFYINLMAYQSAKQLYFRIPFIATGIYTSAYVVDGGSEQNILNIDKSVAAGSVTDTKEIKVTQPEGKYNIVLKKVKEDGTTVITDSEATFKINGQEQNTSKGILNIASNKTIENVKQSDTYEITETKAPNGYTAFNGTLKLNVNFKEVDKKFILDKEKTTTEGFTNGAKVDVENNTITITVPNKEIPKAGIYNVELYKVDELGNVIATPAKFEINGKEATTAEGKIVVASNVEVNDDTTVTTYTIKEKTAPENYTMYDGTISLGVKMSKEGNGYVLKQEGISFKYDAGKLKDASGQLTVDPRMTLDGSTIKIYVPNIQKQFDLALRKFISKVDGKDVTPSREPVINVQSIKNLYETGTASYYHTKESIGVRVGAEVEYTIRVYNEGEILGFAKQITDYLPEGLSFVRIADESSKLYTTESAVGSKVVVLNYSGNTVIKSLRDFFNVINNTKNVQVNVTNAYYQEVKIICKVENTSKTYITSRSEITNYGYTEKDASGKTIWKEAKAIGNVDRDSVQNTIKDSLGLDTWYENAEERTYIDSKTGKTVVDTNYYAGVQDDDDFETVELLAGKYNIIIKKVDKNDEKVTLSNAYFSIVGSGKDAVDVGPTSANGEVTVVKGAQIENEKELHKYTIKETKAPTNYKAYDGNIDLIVGFKYNGSSFEIDTKKTTVSQKDVKISTNKDNTTLTVIIPDEKKEFDLSLRKFITDVNGEKLENSREPQVDTTKLASGEAKTATYTHPKDAVDVNPNDIVTYTIRVFNEGEMDGYATKVMDDIPEGLEFLPDNEVNKTYKWVMYREVKSGEKAVFTYKEKGYVVTDKKEEADLIITDYLSMESNKDNLIKAFDASSKTLDYKDVKVSFKVIEPETSDRTIINYAQITDDSDSNGNSVSDRDSTTNVWIDGEDDQDIEKIKVRYFDLALRKWVTKAIVYENGYEKVTETKHGPWDDPEPVVKVDLKNTNINNVEVKFQYSIRVYNQGEIAGYAKEVSDYIPQGLKFVQSDNPQWKEVDGKVVTRALENTLLQPGEYADVNITLTWINGANNLGLKTNVAEISEDYNEHGAHDIDSTPNNKKDGEDDIDNAPVILAIRTGAPIVYTGIAVAFLAIVSVGVVVIRKRVLAK